MGSATHPFQPQIRIPRKMKMGSASHPLRPQMRIPRKMKMGSASAPFRPQIRLPRYMLAKTAGYQARPPGIKRGRRVSSEYAHDRAVNEKRGRAPRGGAETPCT